MFNKNKKKESESLLEEVDDMYLGESAGISKALMFSLICTLH